MISPLAPPSPEALTEARSWIADCSWSDLDYVDVHDPEVLSDAEVRRGVERHYQGGWQQFLCDALLSA